MERLGRDRFVAVERPAERIDHPAEQAASNRNPRRLACRHDLRADPDRLGLVENRRVDRLRLQRQRIAEPPALEPKKLAETSLRQAGDARDAVGDLLHPPDGVRLGRQSDPRQRFALGMKPIAATSAMAGQFLDDAGKVGAKAVADHGVWRLELEPGDEIGIDGDHEIERPAERLGEGVAARFRFFFAQRAARP